MDEGQDETRPTESGRTESMEMVAGLVGGVQEFREPPSWVQAFSGRLAGRLLAVICSLAVAFLVAWWLTQPTLAEAQQLAGKGAQAKELLETLQALRRDHFDQFRDLFQLVVLSGLVPLFTLLAGHAFGTRQSGGNE